MGKRLLPHKPREGRPRVQHGLTNSAEWVTWQATAIRAAILDILSEGQQVFGGGYIQWCFNDKGVDESLRRQVFADTVIGRLVESDRLDNE